MYKGLNYSVTISKSSHTRVWWSHSFTQSSNTSITSSKDLNYLEYNLLNVEVMIDMIIHFLS